jgi:hypothetical protein
MEPYMKLNLETVEQQHAEMNNPMTFNHRFGSMGFRRGDFTNFAAITSRQPGRLEDFLKEIQQARKDAKNV